MTASVDLQDRVRGVVAVNPYDYAKGVGRANLVASIYVGAARLPGIGSVVTAMENKPVLGVVLSVLVLVKVLDIGFFTAFDRPFRPLDDSNYLGIGIETLGEAVGNGQPQGAGAEDCGAGHGRTSKLATWPGLTIWKSRRSSV